MTKLVSLKAVSLQRNDRQLLRDISFELNKGEIITLIGPNGAGKTTLVNIVLGLLKPDSGIVTRAPSLRFGYMPQKLHLDATFPLSALRFLQLANEDRTTCLNAMQRTGIPDLAKTPMQSLSGGELQRLLLARAILRQPDVLVLDEPVQGVDVTGQEQIYKLITQLRNELGCAVLMVSHDLHLVMGATDHVICLNQHICCHGEPEAVSLDPAFTALFGHRTAPYTHHHDHQHDVHGEVLEKEGQGV